ncbi:MAG: terminase family protein [Smithella sp.]
MSKDLTPFSNNDDLDYDQTYLRNKRLPRPDAQFNWTPEMIAEIKKCREDIHYFAENYFHIVTSDEGKQKIDLYPAQKRALKALQKYRFNIINASRQSGKTTLMTIYALWLTCFEEFKRVVIVANKEATAIMILRRVALAYEELPNWLKPGTAQYGKKEIIFGNHSSIGISTTTGSAVRGDTVNCIIIDEAAHIEDHLMKDFWASVIPTISSSKKRTTKIFMVSTPKGTGNLFYDIFIKAQKGEEDENMKWHQEEIHWYDVPGRGKLWKADMVEALHNDKLLFEQEFNCCFLETGDSAVDIDLLNELELECRDPEQVFEDGHYNVWRPPQEDHIYGMGVDVGEGIGKAASVVQVLDFTDLADIHQVAVYTDRYIHPTRFADIINRIGHHYGCPPVLIERNNIGSETIAVLQEIHQYHNIVTYNPEQLAYGDIRPGIMSHTNTKLAGVMNMRYWVNSSRVVNLYDIGTVQELKTFVRYPNGTWKKKQGDNIFDDRVMSLVWALFLLNDDIAERYYDVVETDDNGKPLRLAAYTFQQNGMFKLDPFFQETPGAPLPAFFDTNPNDDIEEMAQQGWHRLR